MRVLVAGASGAIGRYLVPQLIEEQHEVIGITRTAGSLVSTGAREIVADVLDRSALLAALDGVEADAVVHQLTSLKKSPATLRDMRETNRLRAEGTSALIAAARAVGAKKFVAGSFFGGYGLSDHGRQPLAEDAPFGEPDGDADPVQRALLSLEQQVHAFGGMSLRFGLFYDSTTTSISPVSRTWNGLLPMLHVSDAAAATVRALASYKPSSVYNIADDRPLSYRAREIAQAKAARLGAPRGLPDGLLRVVAPYGSLLLSRASMILSMDLAHTELGWSPQFPSLFDALGVAAPSTEHVVIPVAMAVAVPKAETVPDPTPAVESEPAAEPEPTAEPEPEPEPVEKPSAEADSEADPEADSEVDPEPDPIPDPVVEPKPATASKSKPAQKPRAAPVMRPRTPLKPKEPADPFSGTDDAIARIGTLHED